MKALAAALVEAQRGLCHCGCGGRTNIATQGHRKLGVKKGDPMRYIRGHQGFKHGLSKTKAYSQDVALRANYGITKADYDAMHEAQAGRCYLCGRDGTRLCVDHNHDTGDVRKLLCNTCNTRLWAVETPWFLEAAKAYLVDHRRDT